ncbi:MAG: LapA family protein [Deltaproteobacteria bacterium]|nr:LapA family protein [Deltaproteobacteria bacterium]
MMRIIYTIIVVLLILFVISFSLANTSLVTLKYYDILDVAIPTYMLLFISFLAGVLFTGFMGIVERFRLTRTISQMNKTIRDLRRELRERDEPVPDEDETAGYPGSRN